VYVAPIAVEQHRGHRLCAAPLQVQLHTTTSGEHTSGERTSGDSGLVTAQPRRTSIGSHADSFGSSHLPAGSLSTGTARPRIQCFVACLCPFFGNLDVKTPTTSEMHTPEGVFPQRPVLCHTARVCSPPEVIKKSCHLCHNSDHT